MEYRKRPEFLGLPEVQEDGINNTRPIIVPKDLNLIPLKAGYAECANVRKSCELNQDQACFFRGVLKDDKNLYPEVCYVYFGIFDGHGGHRASKTASMQLHLYLECYLDNSKEFLLPPEDEIEVKSKNPLEPTKKITKDDLIIGTLEMAFANFDDYYKTKSGCTACVVLFIFGKMYVANAGDSRAVLCQRKSTGEVTGTPLSFDHKPHLERKRLDFVAEILRLFMDDPYNTHTYFPRNPTLQDIGKTIFYRSPTMKGWSLKIVDREDCRKHFVVGEEKGSRLLKKLAVSRGFGNHIKMTDGRCTVKSFFIPVPEVTVVDLSTIQSLPEENNKDGEYGVLIMGTDGLWDVLENDVVAEFVFSFLKQCPEEERRRYTMLAHDLVAKARGTIDDKGEWFISKTDKRASIDDISVFVIPVYNYYLEYLEWKKLSETFQNEQKVAVGKVEDVIGLVNGLKDIHVTDVVLQPSIG